MTDELEMERIAEKAVRSTLTALGINVEDPLEAQRDFATLREVGALVRDPEFRKDIEHTRTWRLALRDIKSHGIKAALTVVIGGVLGALWIGFKSFLPGATP